MVVMAAVPHGVLLKMSWKCHPARLGVDFLIT